MDIALILIWLCGAGMIYVNVFDDTPHSDWIGSALISLLWPLYAIPLAAVVGYYTVANIIKYG